MRLSMQLKQTISVITFIVLGSTLHYQTSSVYAMRLYALHQTSARFGEPSEDSLCSMCGATVRIPHHCQTFRCSKCGQSKPTKFLRQSSCQPICNTCPD